ncbi:antiterminator Q family protein [Pseudomonas sp. 5P_3.1_Bac2]|uniref:antiterminator Q family protein n=1 Tax=Pseudomonas sp. 5P_3.1_Bac2 TaxID=2971617 RepID=UPI0021C7BA81|nr:antiterminator Q family protein [Pseudomonas sp. 5P_3.1_Bac2]MCU1719533.1 antitermination protein Q [Pseudomonas sp. 5P_3.1_Bac2]
MKKRQYSNKPLGDTEWLLEQWGWWRMDGEGVPGYVSPLYRLIRDNKGGAGTRYNIADAMALAIDSAVARLFKRDQQMGEFVWLYFGAKWTALRIGRENGLSEGSVRQALRAGVAWVDSALESLRESA